MTDGVDKIASATGIARPELLSIWASVKLNQQRLDACVRHDFQPITPGQFGTKYVCNKCSGTVDGMSARWYERGILHGNAK